MNFGSKETQDSIKTISGLGIGFLAWESAATAKAAKARIEAGGSPPYGLFQIDRFGDALAGIIGTQNVKKIIPGYVSTTAANIVPTLKIQDAINGTTLSGIAVLIANSLAKDKIKAYRDFDGITSFVEGAGIGMTVGGIIGGIFDPVPSVGAYHSTPPQASPNLMSGGNVPFPRGGPNSPSSNLMS